ncbi:MAG TPA: EMC3/TMCO1 family protein [archaeon]|nr:EMC3/TMCO1 family protein [archaeon]
MVFFGALLDISVISAVLAVISKGVQAKFVDRKKMKENQGKMKEKQKRLQELMKKNDQKSKNEAESLQKEMMDSMREMLAGTNKVLIFSLVFFLPAFYLLGLFYGEAIITLPIPMPWLANGFDLFSLGTWGVEIYPQTNWFGWYFVSYLAVTLLLNGAEKAYEKISFSKGVVNG